MRQPNLDMIGRDHADPVVENLRHVLRQWARVLTRREMYEVTQYERRVPRPRVYLGLERRSA